MNLCRSHEYRAAHNGDKIQSKHRVRETMNNRPIGIVTVEVNGTRYRGAYKFQHEEFVVTAYGLVSASIDATVLSGENDRIVLNLAKLMLTDMVNDADTTDNEDLTLSMQGSTSTMCY